MNPNVTKELSAAIRKLIPGLPDNTTRIELILEVGKTPIVNCSFIVKRTGEVVTESRSYYAVAGKGNPANEPMPPPNSVSIVG